MHALKEDHIGLAPLIGGSLYYEKSGEGPALILLHPGFADARTWDAQIDELSTNYTCIRYDQRGAGRSSVPSIPFSHVDDLRALMEYLEIPHAHLLGHSVGGQIALDFSLEYPAQVDSLVLLSPGLSGYFWSEAFLDWLRHVYSDFTVEGITERTLSAPFYASAMQNPFLAKKLRLLTLHNVQKLLAWKCHDLKWPVPDAISRLPSLSVSLLVMLGSNEGQDIHTIAELLKKEVKASQIHSFEGADHFPNLEFPAEFNAEVLNFLSVAPDGVRSTG